MSNKIKRAYRQGQVLTENHPSLNKGQIVEIVSEGDFHYTVQSFHTGGLEKIEKKDLQLD
jgi:translation elongation factor EF-Ts